MSIEIARLRLQKMHTKIQDEATFRGVKSSDPNWTKEDLKMMCDIFAQEWNETQEKYFEQLRNVKP